MEVCVSKNMHAGNLFVNGHISYPQTSNLQQHVVKWAPHLWNGRGEGETPPGRTGRLESGPTCIARLGAAIYIYKYPVQIACISGMPANLFFRNKSPVCVQRQPR